ncbi:sugar-transfer associated ATP-grasp domain-containing protein [Microbacterium terrisoli]|jgi:glutathione synthase/RimK-type ligase-like ATP-grasp enzyme|uniref:sugar-transfer associated ATP-grasp domain-containing protein n=1 Tax=Microbacterium terrisoli TaxID=3242192 RepID=UPI002803A269|nr:sugar-transfer associated ATP-grasp domain-containing protein [Microbacterium protaetiae]
MGQLAVRLRYLAGRARKLSPANLAEFTDQVKRVSKAPSAVIIADMLWCSVRYDMGFRDYAVWDIRLLKGRERATWMTHPKSFRITRMLNSAQARPLVEDKPRFYQDFADDIRREWLDVRIADDDELRAFLRRHDVVIAKPTNGFGGGGIDRVTTADIGDVTAWRAGQVAKDQTLIEEVLPQHPDLAAVYPGSVNTVRLVTFLGKDGTFHVIAGVLRIGNGGVIDNFAGGGMFTMLDDDGVALYAGVDKQSHVYETHPVTGVQIKGLRVPMYREAVAMAERLSRRLPQIPYMGWDIAITPDGPAVIEANHNSSVFQMKPTVSGVRTGLLSRYRDATGLAL